MDEEGLMAEFGSSHALGNIAKAKLDENQEYIQLWQISDILVEMCLQDKIIQKWYVDFSMDVLQIATKLKELAIKYHPENIEKMRDH